MSTTLMWGQHVREMWQYVRDRGQNVREGRPNVRDRGQHVREKEQDLVKEEIV